MSQITTIQLKKSTRKRLQNFGAKGDSYDDILAKLMDFYRQEKI